MARQALVLDASVGVKWLSAKGESHLAKALAIRDGHVTGDIKVIVPDLFFYEVANALAHKKHIPVGAAGAALANLFALKLETVTVNAELMEHSVKLARRFAITVYDACYPAVAHKYRCPLVTANPRHQAQVLNCEVIPLENWR